MTTAIMLSAAHFSGGVTKEARQVHVQCSHSANDPAEPAILCVNVTFVMRYNPCVWQHNANCIWPSVCGDNFFICHIFSHQCTFECHDNYRVAVLLQFIPLVVLRPRARHRHLFPPDCRCCGAALFLPVVDRRATAAPVPTPHARG